MAASTNGDVSKRALSIARMIDRLGPGRHRIELVIDEYPGSPWELSVSQMSLVTKMTKSMEVVDLGDVNTAGAGIDKK